jgi:hypothetical protein
VSFYSVIMLRVVLPLVNVLRVIAASVIMLSVIYLSVLMHYSFGECPYAQWRHARYRYRESHGSKKVEGWFDIFLTKAERNSGHFCLFSVFSTRSLLSISPPLSLSLSLSYTHTHTHTHSLSLSLSLSPFYLILYI